MTDLPPLKLEHWRRYRGLSQRDLAKAAGVSQVTVHLLEQTEQRAQPRTLRKLAKALECSPSELYFSPLEVESPGRS